MSGILSRLTGYGCVFCLIAALAACAPVSNERMMPIPSAARGGVTPPATAPESEWVPRIVAPSTVIEIPAPNAPVATAVPPVTESQPQPVAAPPAAPGANAYILGIGDEIKVTVYGEDDLSGQYDVGSTGTVALPLIGDVVAAGHTIGEFEAAVRAKLAQGYLKEPRVSAQIAAYRPFFILGEVAKPGSYPYMNGMTVINAVAIAGGYTYRADTGDIRIMHANDPQKTEQDAAETTDVIPGDVIRVTERFF